MSRLSPLGVTFQSIYQPLQSSDLILIEQPFFPPQPLHHPTKRTYTSSALLTLPLPPSSPLPLFGLPSLAARHKALTSPTSSSPPTTLPTQKYRPPFPPSNNLLHPSTASSTFRLATLKSRSRLTFLTLELTTTPPSSSSSSTGTNISSTPRTSDVRSSVKHPVMKARVASRPEKKW